MPEFVEATGCSVALAAEGGEAQLADGTLGVTIPAYGYVVVNK
jgi:hypothetical protein